jgi:Tat-targeted selenate reductase subunit YnfE
MLPILTGNVGINGGNSGARIDLYLTIERLPVLVNPVKTAISCFSWTDAIARGPEMTALRDGVRGKEKLDVPIKFIWNYAGNTLVNQHSDINKTHEILEDEKKCEMIVVIENFMTSSAKYADILLPDLMTVEQEDIIPNDYAGNMGYLIFIQPATTAKFERKPIYWILSEVAKRLGDDIYQRFTEGRTQEQWLQYLYAKMLARDPALPGYEALKEMGIYKRKDPDGHFVAYRNFREDPLAHPLKTLPAKLRFTPASWRILPPVGSCKKMKPSARYPFTPPLSKAGMTRCATSSRCSFSVFTTRPEPTPATATSMCYRPPVARRCGSIRLMPGRAALKTAIWCASSTRAANCGLRRKSRRASCPASRPWVREHGMTPVWTATASIVAPALIP